MCVPKQKELFEPGKSLTEFENMQIILSNTLLRHDFVIF